ncbi:MAG: TatD family hydrolase [Alphaproteobacteria bacterium]|nr:TatD family hydrolase [Rickettsiales bacterium]
MIIDSHCHLEYYSSTEVDALMLRCKENNVIHLQNICVDIDDFKKVASFSYKYPNVSCSIGVHPCNVSLEKKAPSVKDLEFCYFPNKAIVNSVGETGLDYSNGISKELQARQKESFANHILFASKYNKPIIIHIRGDGVEDDVLDIVSSLLKSGVNFSGVLHCFTGSLGFMQKMLELGFYVSFSGIVTFKNAVSVRQLVENVPLDRVLVETDSPYLSPHPFRGHKNEPAMVRIVADCVRGIYNAEEGDFSKIVCQNYINLFNTKINKG